MEPNGTFRAKCVPRKNSRLRKHSKNIAAIDFGTKNCSLAYITESDKIEITRGIPKLPLNGTFLRVPTVVLFNPKGEVESFGHDARTLHANLEDCEREEYVYFEELKMNLHHDEEVSRDFKVMAMNGHSYYLVDIISHILRYLKDEFLVRHLKRGGHAFEMIEFDWVITVPAIWKARGKQLMREAGYKAGLCSYQPCSKLTVASHQVPRTPSEPEPDRLSLALEPESASLYCQEMLKRGLVAPYCDNPSGPYTPHSYLLVDIGGGTVDISAHKVVKCNATPNPTIEELHPPVGNACGGTKVNLEFVKFLERLVSDLDFSRFVDTCDKEINIRNRCELNHLVNVVFEEQKQIFGRLPKEKRKEVVIRLPVSMLDLYREDLIDGIETVAPTHVKLIRQNIRISVSKMDEFFRPVVSGIVSCINEVIDKSEGQIDVIYLVGGFGGCPYLYWKILDEFGISYKCFVPPNPEYAVVEGAVLFHANPNVVHARKAYATYGKSVIRPFNNRIHLEEHKIYDDKNIAFCDNLFQTIIEVGEVIQPHCVYTCTSVPSSSDQVNMCVELFRSTCIAADVWYTSIGNRDISMEKGDITTRNEGITTGNEGITTGNEGITTGNEGITTRNGNLVKIGEVVVNFAKQRERTKGVEFLFDFSHTEIQVTACDLSLGTEVKTVVDFLSAKPQ